MRNLAFFYRTCVSNYIVDPPVFRHDHRALSTSDKINLAFGLTMVATSILTVILAYVTWKVTRLTWKWMGRPEKPQRGQSSA
jgi:hypothetical protein